MTTISNNDIARAIYSLSKDKSSEELSTIHKKVVQFLFKKRMLSYAPNILTRLNKIINEAEDRVEAKVTSSQKIDHKTNLHVQDFLKKHYDAKDVILNESVDSTLLGGLKIEVNDEVIDFSMKNKIRRLQDHLITS